MKQKSERPKVALVDLDGQVVPDWVRETLDRDGIDLIIHECATRAELAEHAGDADVVWLFGGSRILQHGNLAAVPQCRAILRTGSGTDNVPVAEATTRNLVVANTPAAMSDGVSDHMIALLFTVVRRVAELDRRVRSGGWGKGDVQPLSVVQGKTLGLVGFGHAARAVVRKLRGFEMKVVAHDPLVGGDVLAEHGVSAVTLDDLLAQADFVSLHCPLTPATRHMIGVPQLRRMKPTAILLNTARGAVIDETALVQALGEGWIAGAGLDVLEQEPPAPENPLLKMENVVVTPHVAGYAANGVEARWRHSMEAIVALARGQAPPSWVNK